MGRVIDDKDYIECLPDYVHRVAYNKWRARMELAIEDIVKALEKDKVENVMITQHLSPRDIALLVRLCFFTEEEVEKFDLLRIERTVPA